MKLTPSLSSLLLLLPLALAVKEIPNPERNQDYFSGLVHEKWMGIKMDRYEQRLQEGAYNSSQFKAIDGPVACVDGYAGEFKCNNIELLHFLTHAGKHRLIVVKNPSSHRRRARQC